jgi:hypothetical protein
MITITALKRYVERPLSELQEMAEKRTYAMIDNNFVVVRVQKETVTIKGRFTTIHRVIVSTSDTGAYKNVGWVHNSDMPYCSICLQDFYFFSSKLHCHACGHIVCRNCCEDDVCVKELEQCGGVQVGKCCYWGQESVNRVPVIPINIAHQTFTARVNTTKLEREQWASSVPRLAALKGESPTAITSSLSSDHAPLLRSFSYGGFGTGGPQSRSKKMPQHVFSSRSPHDSEDAWGTLLCENYVSRKHAHVNGTRSTSGVSALSRKEQRVHDSAKLAEWFTKPAPSVTHTRSVDHSWQDGLTPECQSYDTFDLGGHGVQSDHFAHKAFQFTEASTHKSAGKLMGYNSASIKGQRLLTDDAMAHRQEMCLSSREAAALKRASLENNEILVGWQVSVCAALLQFVVNGCVRDSFACCVFCIVRYATGTCALCASV